LRWRELENFASPVNGGHDPWILSIERYEAEIPESVIRVVYREVVNPVSGPT
jgi:hypothetical protein